MNDYLKVRIKSATRFPINPDGKLLNVFLSIILILFLISCESNDRFYRPNLPEQLCSIGIIDADDTIRYISFEKSFQSEHREEMTDSLRKFSFTISSPGGELFNYHCDSTIKKIKDLRIPDNIEFHTGEKYFLSAGETGSKEILAQVIVPEPPSSPELISVEREIMPLNKPDDCTPYTFYKSAVIRISFTNDPEQNKYYALLMRGFGYSMFSIGSPTGFADFSIRDCNSPGFFSIFYGVYLFKMTCEWEYLAFKKAQYFAYFIDGSKIPENECIITVSTQFHDAQSPIEFLKSINFKLISIPESLFQFEKSLYTYSQTVDDPFSEPVYLNGNIKGGNGVFAICRSSEITVNFSPWF